MGAKLPRRPLWLTLALVWLPNTPTTAPFTCPCWDTETEPRGATTTPAAALNWLVWCTSRDVLPLPMPAAPVMLTVGRVGLKGVISGSGLGGRGNSGWGGRG